MAINPPVSKTIINSATWGIPITNEVNRLTTAQQAGVPTAWTNLTLQNGWVNVGGAQPLAMYRKVADMVYLRGRIASGTLNTAMFTMPVGFRPLALHTFQVPSIVGGTWGFGVVEFAQDGSAAAYAPATNGAIVLNQCFYSTVS